MDAMEAENLLKKLDRRLQNVEQILPTLPTREEMRAEIREAVAPLATKEELAPLPTKAELELLATKADLEPLATRAEVREETERTRRHFDAVAESLRDDIRLIAESQLALRTEVRQGRRDLDGIFKNHEKRITRLEASDARKRRQKSR